MKQSCAGAEICVCTNKVDTIDNIYFIQDNIQNKHVNFQPGHFKPDD